MRLAILTESFPPYVSGITTQVIELSRLLLREGHQVLLLVPRHPRSTRPHGLEAAQIVMLPSFPTRISTLRICRPSIVRVLRALRRFEPDLVETFAPSFLGLDGLIASKVLGVPFMFGYYTLFNWGSTCR
jgi:phosphatidylinositol alpha 1,6-mannosyltransferase